MQNITSTAELKMAIQQLEVEQAACGQLLKEQFHLTYESLKPVNLLSSTIKDLATSPILMESILGTAVGLATGYLSKKIVVGASGNIFRKLFGLLLQIGVSNLVAHNAEGIKTMGQLIFQQLFHKSETNSKNS